MYPNTIEPIRYRKQLKASKPITQSLRNWLSRYMFFLSLNGVLALCPVLLSAYTNTDTTGLTYKLPAQEKTKSLADAAGFVIPSPATNAAERHPLERLRQTIWQNLIADQLVANVDKVAILTLPDELETVNGQAVPFNLKHKYNAIIYSYGIQTGEGVEIRISEDFIMVGTFNSEGILIEGEIRGTHSLDLALNNEK